MSGGNWRVGAALAGLAALLCAAGFGAYFGSLYSPDHKQYGAVAGYQRSQNDYQSPSQSLSDLSAIPGAIERIIANPAPTTGQDHEKRDLAAQEAMAVWAFWMMVAAFASVIVTTIGTIFLYNQIILTREAVKDTGDATKAMLEANSIARDGNERQLRANLSFRDIEVVGFLKGNRPQFKAVLWNAGQTPAYNVRQWSSAWPCEGQPSEHKIRFPKDIKSVSVIGPAQRVHIQNGGEREAPQGVLDEMIEWVISGQGTMVFAGVLTYRDAFGKRRISTFKCYINQQHLDQRGSARLASCLKGNVEN